MTQSDGETRDLRELVTRGTAIGVRLSGLEQAVAAARGTLDDALLDETEAIIDRAAGRLRLSAHHTVVAIAGATGSGKSSTFNALTGLDLSSTGVRRPTTSWATACVWGSDGAGEVLGWLGIPERHRTMRDSMLDTDGVETDLDGVVLMDLPDHDSTEVAHHLEVDRLVELADLLVWVLDPQKYADAAIHDRYLAPYRTHADVILVVLNHIDTIPPDKRPAMVDDVRRLLALDGLGSVDVLPVSARQGIGIDDLRAEISSRVAEKRSSTARVEADVTAAVERLEAAGGDAASREIREDRAQALHDRVVEAAGVPTVVAAVEQMTRARIGRSAAWPPAAVVGRLGRPGGDDPARELVAEYGRGLRIEVAPVPRGVVDNAVRELADDCAGGLGEPWGQAVRIAATGRLAETDDRLDERLAAVDLGIDPMPAWVGAMRLLQWLLLGVGVVGGVWWVVWAARGGEGVPLPAALLLGGGLALGVALWLVGRLLAGVLARSRAEAADTGLRAAVADVLDAEVLHPTEDVLASYSSFREGIDKARG